VTPPTIYELCQPRADVLEGHIRDEDFAAGLSQVPPTALLVADTYVLIDDLHDIDDLRDKEDAVAFLEGRYQPLALSMVSVAQLSQGV
jgi:hypothetical protein